MTTQELSIPKYLERNYTEWGDKRVVFRIKDLGIWKEYTWKDYYEAVKFASLGLIGLGLKPGDKVAIIGDSEPEWYWAEVATQSVLGIPIGLYSEAQRDEIRHYLQHFDCEFIFAHDQEQVDKVLDVKDEVPQLRKVIYWDPKGLDKYDDPILISWEMLIELGEKYDEVHPTLFSQKIDSIKENDICYICLTSGTTGEFSKGAIHTHANYLKGTKAILSFLPLTENDVYFGFLPANIGWEQLIIVPMVMLVGLQVNFPEEPDTAQEDFREISPSCLLYSGTIWDSITSSIQTRIAEGGLVRRLFYQAAIFIGSRRAASSEQGGLRYWFGQLLYLLAYLAVLRPLRDRIGLRRAKYPYNSATMISSDSIKLLKALGINLRQSYGSMELLIVCGHRGEDIKLDTLGVPATGVEVRISDQSGVLVRSDFTCKGYYRDTEKTAALFDKGWLVTGDAGSISEDGHVIYYDRKAHLAMLSTGHVFSPLYIESKLRFSPYIKTAVIIGQDKQYIMALINIDFEAVARYAELHHISYTTFADLSQKWEVATLIQEHIERVSSTLPDSSRIQKYTILHKELDPDEAELTRTFKVRRDRISERHANLIEAVYKGKPEVTIESEVRYRDGRIGKASVVLKIRGVNRKVTE